MIQNYPKKHRNHMSKDEYSFLMYKVSSIVDNIWLSKHTKENMIKRNISLEEIKSVFKDYDIIEYSTRKRDKRVLLREVGQRDRNVCISVSLVNNCICTAYCNSLGDKHFTLREEEYDSNLNIINNCKTLH